jgi:hypothetical protein
VVVISPTDDLLALSLAHVHLLRHKNAQELLSSIVVKERCAHHSPALAGRTGDSIEPPLQQLHLQFRLPSGINNGVQLDCDRHAAVGTPDTHRTRHKKGCGHKLGFLS